MKTIKSTDSTRIIIVDEPGQGGACHKYDIEREGAADPGSAQDTFASIRFQDGPVKEHGVNGCHQEDLILIVIDRLQSFQAGAYRCRENALALTKLEEALHWLYHRTQDRESRGVEGINNI